MHLSRQLDVRTIPPPRRHPQIFETYDGLAAGDAFVLVNDHEPKPLLYQLQAERPGGFDWNVLEAGPERFRVEIKRRDADLPRTVTECLETDHRRLDAMVPEVLRATAAGAWDEARARFAEFRVGLDRHIDIEERILFPVFERATGMTSGGPTFVMRSEHVEIRAAMSTIDGALADRDAAAVEDGFGALAASLGPHNLKEEHVLYPTTDQVLGDERTRADLVERMQAF